MVHSYFNNGPFLFQQWSIFILTMVHCLEQRKLDGVGGWARLGRKRGGNWSERKADAAESRRNINKRERVNEARRRATRMSLRCRRNQIRARAVCGSGGGPVQESINQCACNVEGVVTVSSRPLLSPLPYNIREWKNEKSGTPLPFSLAPPPLKGLYW